MTSRVTAKFFRFTILCGVLLLLNCFWFLVVKRDDTESVELTSSSAKPLKSAIKLTTQCDNRPSNITIAVVVCGDRLEQTVITIKSAIIFSNETIRFIIFSDDENIRKLATFITEEIPSEVRQRLAFEIHPISFPKERWKRLFKLCASQRLFFTSLLNHTDSVIYVDNDVLFLSPVEQMWKFFDQMKPNQMVAVVPEQEDYTIGWYNRFARHPYVEPLGINSGVMLMNLTRMREFQWDSLLKPVYEKYKQKIVFGDQDIINIIFHSHKDKLLMLPCIWNYRPDHCIYGEVCSSAKEIGPKVLHGSRNVFFNNKTLSFKTVYDAIKAHSYLNSQSRLLLNRLEMSQPIQDNSHCGKSYPLILKSLESLSAS